MLFRSILLGTAIFLGEAGIATDPLQPQAERLRADGASVIFVGAGETLAEPEPMSPWRVRV